MHTDLLTKAARHIIHNSWRGGQSAGYYCSICYEFGAPKPKTSSNDIVHTRDCLISRLQAAVATGPCDEDIARVCHAVNRAHCQSLGDQSQPPWEEAPAWQRESAIAGVRFHRANPGAGPEASHQSWLAAKQADGWVYGPVKDPAAKQHPCMVPFDQLPREQQAKDHLFRAIVHALLPRG